MTFCSDILSTLDFVTNAINLCGRSPYIMQIPLVISVKIHTHFANLQDQRNHFGHPQHSLLALSRYSQYQNAK